MTLPTRHVTSIAALALLLVSAAIAGPLTPPVGPVAPTGKTTQEVFEKVIAVESRIAINATNTPGDADSLFKITQPGSYYLTGNITGVVGKHGIEITSSGVTLDLNGFDLVGVPAMGAFDGVTTIGSTLTNIAVLNGSVRDWGDEGVDLLTFGAISSRVDNVRASGNAGNGLRVGTGCTLTNCAAYNNAGNGINAGNGCTLKDCAAYANTLNGFFISARCTVTGCTASFNLSDGIDAGNGCTITHCTSFGNTGTGIDVGSGCSVSHCTTNSNIGNGIDAVSGCTIADCTVQGNGVHGIQCINNCVIRNNTCDGNGTGASTTNGAGISVTGSDNRIEGNNCTDADRGIDVIAAGNIIIRNTCSGNTTDWVIAANNIYGQIVDRRITVPVPSTPAVNGTSAASTLGSSEANANFTY